MEKFITRKRKLSIDQSTFAVVESESTDKVSVSFAETESTHKGTGTLEKTKKHRLYCNSYLNFGQVNSVDTFQKGTEIFLTNRQVISKNFWKNGSNKM